MKYTEKDIGDFYHKSTPKKIYTIERVNHTNDYKVSWNWSTSQSGSCHYRSEEILKNLNEGIWILAQVKESNYEIY